MLQEKPSALKIEHPTFQKMKYLHFFLFLWVIFALLDPDPIRVRTHNTAFKEKPPDLFIVPIPLS